MALLSRPRWFVGTCLILLTLFLAGAGRWGYQRWHAENQFRFAREQTDAFHYETAYAAIREAIALRPDRLDMRFFAARAARRVLDMKEAKRLLDACASEMGKSDEFRLEQQLYAVQVGNAGRFAEETLWLRVPTDSAHRVLILEALLRGALETNRLTDAQKAIDAWLETPTDDARPYFFRGLLYEQFGESLKEKAFVDYRTSLERDPDYDECRLQLAELLVKVSRVVEASQHFELLHRRRPDNPEITVGLARCYADLGKTEAATELLDQVLATNGQHGNALRDRGILALEQNRAAEAEPFLRKAVEVMPQDPAASYNLYRALQQQGKTDEAIKQLARHDALNEKLERLRILMKEQVASGSRDPRALCEIGILYLETGRPDYVELGRSWIERAIAADAHYKPAYEALARYYDKKNRPDLAGPLRDKAK